MANKLHHKQISTPENTHEDVTHRGSQKDTFWPRTGRL